MALVLPLVAVWLVMNVALRALAALLDRRRRPSEVEARSAQSAGRVIPMALR